MSRCTSGFPTGALDPTPSNILFGALASVEEACNGIFIVELSLFWRLIVVNPKAEQPLMWWKLNASRLPSISFLARQILAIPGSRIEMERIFSIAGVLTSLRHCRLGLNNQDSLIMINKNWLDDSRHECEVTEVVIDVKDYFAKEMDVVGDIEDLIKVVVGRHVQSSITFTLTHHKFIFQPRDINLVDAPNKRNTSQVAQWNRKTGLDKKFDSNPVNHKV